MRPIEKKKSYSKIMSTSGQGSEIRIMITGGSRDTVWRLNITDHWTIGYRRSLDGWISPIIERLNIDDHWTVECCWSLDGWISPIIERLNIADHWTFEYRRSLDVEYRRSFAGTLRPLSGIFGSKSRVFNFFIVIHNDGLDYINEFIPHINNL
jgi:hypothetical protein